MSESGQDESSKSGDATQGDHSHAAETRRLIDAAIEVFGQHGYDAATLPAIAQRAGSTTDALRSRWTDKDKLFEAAFEHAFSQRMILLAKSAPVDADQKLALLGSSLLGTQRDATRDMWIEACARARRDENWCSALARWLDLEATEVVEIVDEGKAAGIFADDLNVDAIAMFCHALGLGSHLLFKTISQERAQVDSSAWDDVIARFITGLRLQPMDAQGC